jgi:inner membrane protein
MDPLSQGLLGAALPQSIVKKNSKLWVVALIGFLSGMAPDLDILIKSNSDPLLFLEYHRQFTHSLLFIPMGGFICASFFWLLLKKYLSSNFTRIWIIATLGYGTHGLLDACTSYGTLLFWPFSNERFAWNNISIVDPLFTLPILLLLIISIVKNKKIYSQIALAWALLYLTTGLIVHNEIKKRATILAESRNHKIETVSVKPTLGNLMLWKIIYEYDGYFYTDGIRILPSKKIIQGTKIKKLNINHDLTWLNHNSQQAIDLKRFNWFSSNHLAISSSNPNLIIDARYSILPNEISGLWGIELNKEANQSDHVKFVSNRSLTQKPLRQLWDMIWKN